MQAVRMTNIYRQYLFADLFSFGTPPSLVESKSLVNHALNTLGRLSPQTAIVMFSRIHLGKPEHQVRKGTPISVLLHTENKRSVGTSGSIAKHKNVPKKAVSLQHVLMEASNCALHTES
jgi:hypothetical protein